MVTFITMNHGGQIVIFHSGKSAKGGKVEVRLTGETVWLSQKQMANLFGKDTDTIGLHIKNIYKSRELSPNATTELFSVVQKEGKKQVSRRIKLYNLDVILSVGYRVSSKRGTQFRIWANKVLKDYLVQGYAVNEKRLKAQTEKIRELEKTVGTLTALIDRKTLSSDEAVGLVQVIRDYTYGLDLLDQYDHQCVAITDTRKRAAFQVTYDDARLVIDQLRKEFLAKGETVGFFGQEKDDSFRGSLYNIYQTFGEQELYPSIEEKAAHLLYFLIKNHSFIDGNKRIGAFLFLWFLEKNKLLYGKNGSKRIEDNALVAICLMIAESHPDEKDTITKMLVNLINKRNR